MIATVELQVRPLAGRTDLAGLHASRGELHDELLRLLEVVQGETPGKRPIRVRALDQPRIVGMVWRDYGRDPHLAVQVRAGVLDLWTFRQACLVIAEDVVDRWLVHVGPMRECRRRLVDGVWVDPAP